MRLRLNTLTLALVAMTASGCAEHERQVAPGPRTPAAVLAVGGCDFNTLNYFAGSYFNPNEAPVVEDLISQMAQAGPTTSAGQDYGFDVMSHIASNISAGNGDANDAGNLTNGLLGCMYSDTADLPRTFPEDFSVATDPSLHGAYAVRGGANDPDTAVVFSRPFTSPFSGVAPPPGTTWAGMLGGDPAPQRFLVYGKPGSQPETYDWRVVPRRTGFSPGVIVGVCLDPFAYATSLVTEENIGLLAFVNARFMDLSTCSPTSAARSISGPLQFARGALKWGASLFAPSALLAANPTFVDGLGGSTGGVHSEFGPERVDTVTLTFTVQPTDIHVGQTIRPPVVVRATHASTGEAVANVAVTLTAGPNYGKPACLLGTLTRVTDASGNATFPDLSETKPGAYVLNASGTVGGRPAIVVLRTSSARFNVRPRDDDDDRGRDDHQGRDDRGRDDHQGRPDGRH